MGSDTPRQLVTRRLRSLLQNLQAAREGDPVAIHRTRVAGRRLRETLVVVARNKRGRTLSKVARRVTRALGRVRDADVMLAMLAECSAAAGVSHESVAGVTSVIAEERRRRLVGMRKRLARREMGVRGTRALETLKARQTREAIRALVRRTEIRGRRRAMRLGRAVESAAGLYLPDRLRGVRVGVKKLRYALEVGQQLRMARQRPGTTRPSKALRAASARLRTLKRVQDQLGRMHDLEMLIVRIRALQGTPAVTGLHVSADLDRLVRRLEHECRELHGKYMVLRGDILAVCDHAERAAEKRQRAGREDGR